MIDRYCSELQLLDTFRPGIEVKNSAVLAYGQHCKAPESFKTLKLNVESYVEKVSADGLDSKMCNFLLKQLQEFLNRELDQMVPLENISIKKQKNRIKIEVTNSPSKKSPLRQMYLSENLTEAKRCMMNNHS